MYFNSNVIIIIICLLGSFFFCASGLEMTDGTKTTDLGKVRKKDKVKVVMVITCDFVHAAVAFIRFLSCLTHQGSGGPLLS